MSKARRAAGTLEMLLVSLINRGDGVSGYELAATLREPVPFIWPVKHSQIYPALAILEGKGDLLGRWVEQRGRPNKKVYSVSEQGRERLRDWLMEPRSEISQDEILLLAYNSELIGMAALRETIAAYRRQSEAETDQLEARWLRVRLHESDPETAFMSVRAVYELAVRTRRSRVEWCDWLLAQVEALAASERPAK